MNPMTETILPAGHRVSRGKRVISTSTILSLCSATSLVMRIFGRQLFVGRRDEEDLAVKPQLPDDRFPRPLFHGDDAAFGSAARLCGR